MEIGANIVPLILLPYRLIFSENGTTGYIMLIQSLLISLTRAPCGSDICEDINLTGIGAFRPSPNGSLKRDGLSAE